MGLLWGLPFVSGYGQGIVWEKQFGFAPGNEQLFKVCPTQDGNYFAIGTSSKYSQTIGNGTYGGAILIKFNGNGDTLFMRNLNITAYVISFVGHKFNGVYQAVFTTAKPGFASYRPVIVEFTEEGIVLQTKIFEDLVNYLVRDCIRTPDFGLLMVGTGIGPGGNLCAYKFNFLNELEWGNAYFPPAPVTGIARRAEHMANGHYLVSGTLGRRIYGYEVDTAGNEIGQKTYYETPSNLIFDEGAVLQAWRKSSLSYGFYINSSNQYVGYFGRHDSLGHRIWGGETTGELVNNIITNRENSFLISKNGNSASLSRLTKDSIQLWKVSLSTPGVNRFLYGICFTENDTGIVYGYYRAQSSGNQGEQFYIAKIAGVGTAYDPTHPEDTVTVSAQEKLFRPKDAPVLYPNPVCENFQFSKLTQESVLAMYSIKGEKLFEKPLQPGEKVNATNLPKGIYLYHLQMGKKVFTGKMIKE